MKAKHVLTLTAAIATYSSQVHSNDFNLGLEFKTNHLWHGSIVTQQAKRHLRLQDELVKLDKYSLLIVDDVGYVRKTEQETSVLFELIAHRYERHSMIITSNKSFEQWDELFDDSTMTVAAIDRLVHHATIIHCEGESYRRKTALNKSK